MCQRELDSLATGFQLHPTCVLNVPADSMPRVHARRLF